MTISYPLYIKLSVGGNLGAAIFTHRVRSLPAHLWLGLPQYQSQCPFRSLYHSLNAINCVRKTNAFSLQHGFSYKSLSTLPSPRHGTRRYRLHTYSVHKRFQLYYQGIHLPARTPFSNGICTSGSQRVVLNHQQQQHLEIS